MNTTPDPVAVRYIGFKPEWRDRLYGSGLTFAPKQERTVPWELARRFLRHADLFARVEGVAALPADPEAKTQDDTAELLEQAASERAAREKAEFDLADLHREVDNMDFTTLTNFAENRYGLKLTKQKGLERGRADVHARIDQFGSV